jgi:hypothetical protein
LNLEAEFALLGLAADSLAPLAMGGGPDRTEAVMGLRGLLLTMRGQVETGWGESLPEAGVWGAVRVPTRTQPNLALWLDQLRELIHDLRGVAAPGQEGKGGNVRQVVASRPLSQTKKEILDALADGPCTGPTINRRVQGNYDYQRRLPAEMVKDGLLKRGEDGYELTARGRRSQSRHR